MTSMSAIVRKRFTVESKRLAFSIPDNSMNGCIVGFESRSLLFLRVGEPPLEEGVLP